MSYSRSPAVDAYVAALPAVSQERFTILRDCVIRHFSKTVEDISYGMPTYRPAPGKRGLIHISAPKDAVAIYAVFDQGDDPAITPILKKYRTGKATLHFRNDEPLPVDDLGKIVAYQARATSE